MHKLIVFDLDDTLAPIGRQMSDEDVNKLRDLEAAGYRIAICSGKPTFYLLFFVKHFSLKSPSKFPVFIQGISLQLAATYFRHPCA